MVNKATVLTNPNHDLEVKNTHFQLIAKLFQTDKLNNFLSALRLGLQSMRSRTRTIKLSITVGYGLSVKCSVELLPHDQSSIIFSVTILI
jgi:hypothetical protein